ncbi:MAG: hypothetical protein HQL51_15040 [Magnetococcales bacterium]|nr:hypothetical protein [Magnetococcales bacterium]
MDLLTAGLTILELWILITGLALRLREHDASPGESFTYAVLIVFGFFSATIQTFFWLHLPQLHWGVDVIALGWAGREMVLRRARLRAIPAALRAWLGEVGWFTPGLLALCLLYMLIQGWWMHPLDGDSLSYNMPRILLMMQEKSLFLTNFNEYRMVSYPYGHDILHYLTLRWHSPYGSGHLSWLAYLVVVVGTYALVLRFTENRKLAWLTAFLIASLKLLLMQATSAKNDLPAAAVAVGSFLGAYNVFTRRGLVDLAALGVALTYGASVKGYMPAFVGMFGLFYTGFLAQQGRLRPLWTLLRGLKAKPLATLLALPLLLTFLTGLYFAQNYARHQNIFGYPPLVEPLKNKDGLLGGAVNMFRYTLQSLDLSTSTGGLLVEDLHDAVLGDYKEVNVRFHNNHNITFKRYGTPPFIPNEARSWFGPLGALLVIPGVLYVLFFVPGYPRVVALTLVSFFVILSFQIVFIQYNNRFFSLFFAGSGLCAALFLQRLFRPLPAWNVALLRGGLIALASVVMIFTLTFHKYKYALEPFAFFERGRVVQPFHWLRYVDPEYDHDLGRGALRFFRSQLPRGARILYYGTSLLPLMTSRPDVSVMAVNLNKEFLIGGERFNVDHESTWKRLPERFDYVVVEGSKLTEGRAALLEYAASHFIVTPFRNLKFIQLTPPDDATRARQAAGLPLLPDPEEEEGGEEREE